MQATDGPSRRAALGRAIRRYRGEDNQIVLAERMGVSQATISNWELGIFELTCEQVSRLERSFGLTPGTLLLEAGYVAASLAGLNAAASLALIRLDLATSALVEAVVSPDPATLSEEAEGGGAGQ